MGSSLHLKSLACLLLAALPFTACALTDYFGVPEDAHLNMDQQLTKYGYNHTIHWFPTKDNYILKCYRIQKCDTNKGLPLVLQHGLWCNSLDYLVAGQGAALGYLAADECYDTWICNNRGNFESRNNSEVSPDKKEFWYFSWHEMGVYDLPAIFNHVLNTSGQPMVNYVGHSEGTTQFFVYCSMFPDDCKKTVNHFHALAPVAIMTHTGQPFLKFFAKNVDALKLAFEALDMYEFRPRNNFTTKLTPIGCQLDPFDMLSPCASYFTSGDDPQQYDKRTQVLAASNDPAGSSMYQSVHYAQNMNSDYFHMYDHGPEKNMELYNQTTPPPYPIEKIPIPCTFWYGENDMLTNWTDVEKAAGMMQNVELRKMPNPHFGHTDFIYSKDVGINVNKPVMAEIAKN